MNLSKAFDCTNHGVLVAKLSAYGIKCISDALQLIRSYLTNRKQRVILTTPMANGSKQK